MLIMPPGAPEISAGPIRTRAAGCRQLRGLKEPQRALAWIAHDGVLVGLSHGRLLGPRLTPHRSSHGSPDRAQSRSLGGRWSLQTVRHLSISCCLCMTGNWTQAHWHMGLQGLGLNGSRVLPGMQHEHG